MGHWGWRRMAAAFISVWVVGCTITHDAAPTLSPTFPPNVTLIAHLPTTPTPFFPLSYPAQDTLRITVTPVVYTVQEGDTLLQIARQFGVELPSLQAANGGIEPLALQIGQPLLIPSPKFDSQGTPVLPTSTPSSILLPSPMCYATPTEYIICLGQVINSLDEAVERVAVQVELVGATGEAFMRGKSAVEQSIIPPGGVAPYRLLFKADWQDYAGASVRLESADSASTAADRFVTVNVEEQTHQWIDGRYALSAVLHNATEQSARLVRAVVTLRDDGGQVTGYRVAQLDSIIAPGERIPFSLQVMSNTPDKDAVIAHSIYLEALRVP